MRNNFKKFAAIALALVMCVSALVPVFAVDACPGVGSVHTKDNCTYDVVGTNEADCEVSGGVTGRCKTCAITFAVETTPAFGHKWETKEGDCTTGSRQVCATCGETQNVAAAADHKWEKFVVDGECEEGATATAYCANCPETKQITMEYDHNWVLVTLTAPVNCITKGTATYKCGTEGCTATQTRDVFAGEAEGHNFVGFFNSGIEVTMPGKKITETDIDDKYDELKDLKLDITKEQIRAAKKDAASTCLVAGTIAQYCANCGETRTLTLDKATHVFVNYTDEEIEDDATLVQKNVTKSADFAAWLDALEWDKNPTCDTKGYKPYAKCNVDGCTAVKTLNINYDYNVYFDAGEDEDSDEDDTYYYNGEMTWDIPSKYANFTAMATSTEKKDVAAFEAMVVITTKLADYQLAASHVWESEAGTPATCTKAGKFIVTCDNCDTNWKNTIKPEAIGHSFYCDLTEEEQEEYTTDTAKKATLVAYQSCQSPELYNYECLNGCGKVKDEVETKPQLECTASTIYGAASFAATCEEPGELVTVCKYCGDELATEEIPQLECNPSVKCILQYPTHKGDDEAVGYYVYVCEHNGRVEYMGRKYTEANAPKLGEKGKMENTDSKGTLWIENYECSAIDPETVELDSVVLADCYEIDPIKSNEHVWAVACRKCNTDKDAYDIDYSDCAFCGGDGWILKGEDNAIIECQDDEITYNCLCVGCTETKTDDLSKVAHNYYTVNGADQIANEFILKSVVSDGTCGTKTGSCDSVRTWRVACKYCFVLFDDIADATDATDTSKSETKYTKLFTDDVNYGNGHKEVIVDAKVEPTCTTVGYEATYYCSACKELGTATEPEGGMEDGELIEIPMLHDYTEAEIKALIKKAVKNLKYKIIDESATVAKFVGNVTDNATLIKSYTDRVGKDIFDYQAWTAYLISDASKDEEEWTMLPEVAIDDNLTFVFAVAGTCGEAPVLGGLKCNKCNVTNLKTTAENFVPDVETIVDGMKDPVVNAHDFEAKETQPEKDEDKLCGVDYYDVKFCKECEIFVLQNFNSVDHKFTEEGDKLAATCVLDGYTTMICEKCKAVEVTVVPASGHVTEYGDKIVDTCLDRTVDRNCDRCKLVVPMSHRFGDWTVVDGVEVRSCVDCIIATETKEVVAPETEAPVTDAPVTDAPVVDEPATDAPETDAPVVDEPAKKGCKSSIAAIGVALVATLGTCAVFCGKKED